jgi:hypothetical protein
MKKSPIKFKNYGEKDFEYELAMVREYSDADAIASIILYRVDIVKSRVHNVYGEAKASEKKFLTPIDLNITLEIGDSKTDFIASNGIFRESFENIKFGVYKDELEEKSCTINRGDFFTYFDGNKDRTFEISKVSNMDSHNSSLGYKSTYILVEAVHVTKNVIDIIN